MATDRLTDAVAITEMSSKMYDAVFQFTDFEAFFAADLDPKVLLAHRQAYRSKKAARTLTLTKIDESE